MPFIFIELLPKNGRKKTLRNDLAGLLGGEIGIRTLDTRKRILDFENTGNYRQINAQRQKVSVIAFNFHAFFAVVSSESIRITDAKGGPSASGLFKSPHGAGSPDQGSKPGSCGLTGHRGVACFQPLRPDSVPQFPRVTSLWRQEGTNSRTLCGTAMLPSGALWG